MKLNIRKLVPILFFSFLCGIYPIDANAQYENPDRHSTELKNGDPALKQEKQELKMMLQEHIESTEEALYHIKTEMNVKGEKMEDDVKQSMEELETSLKVYKESLELKLNQIDDLSAEKWAVFKHDTVEWWSEIERGFATTLKKVENQMASSE